MGSYYIPRNTKGEGRFLYIFTAKALVVTAVMALIGLGISYILSLFIKPIPLMYAVGKIGCFLVGCCYGIEYSGPFSIVYKYSMNDINGISLFPVQIVESIVFMIIFIITIVRKIDIYKLILMCSISKFLLDFLRFKNNNMILSVNQIGCLFIIVISLILIYKSNEKKKQI